MKKETRKTIFVGVNFGMSPRPGMGSDGRLEFQRQLSEENIVHAFPPEPYDALRMEMRDWESIGLSDLSDFERNLE